jgi:hypothetical protein
MNKAFSLETINTNDHWMILYKACFFMWVRNKKNGCIRRTKFNIRSMGNGFKNMEPLIHLKICMAVMFLR